MKHSELIELIPSRSPYVQRIAPAKNPTEQDSVFHNLVDIYRDLSGKRRGYPYCKLEFLQLLCRKCTDNMWIKSHTEQLVYAYFALVFDDTLLFAQTRELTPAKTAVTYREYMTNMNGMKGTNRQSDVKEAVKKLGFYFDKSDTKITEENFKSMLEILREALCPPKGKPCQLIKCPQREMESLCYRDKNDDHDSRSSERDEKLYQITTVLGKTASVFYQENIARMGIVEDEWKELVVKWLPRLDSYIKANRSKYKNYSPYFLLNQWEEFQNLQERVKTYSKEFLRVLSYKSSGNFKEDVPLPNKLSLTEKLDTFELYFKRLMSKHLSADGPSPETVGILFLLRAYLHPILRESNVKYPEASPEQQKFISIEAGKHYFDEIEEHMKRCLLYKPRDLLSIDGINIKPENVTCILPKLDPYVEKELKKTGSLTPEVIESYAQIFFNPVYQKDALREKLQEIVHVLDWSQIPLAEAVQKVRCFGSMELCIAAWKGCLLEYRLMECLVSQGHQNLREITRRLFRVWGGF